MNISDIKTSIQSIVNSKERTTEKLRHICDLLSAQIDYFDWVGFYFNNGDKNELKLAQYSGAPTDHKIIPFGKGICGQVAISNKNFVVPDVLAQDNYLSCGANVKSEMVIPIFVNGKNIGQIDVDSHHLNPFSKEDELLLEFVCEQVAKLYTF